MKIIFYLQLVAMPFIVTPIYCAEKEANPVSVGSEYAGGSSNLGTEEIVLKRSDGSTTFLTKNGSMERVPMLSHDNSVIAFLRRVDSNEDGTVNWDDEVELWLMRLSNRAESRLAVNLSKPSMASWHPSKMRLTFIATNAEGSRGLYVYDLPSKSLKLLSDDAHSWPTWSPKGDYIAYYGSKHQVIVFDIEKKNSNVLSGDVGNTSALYWLFDNRLLFTQEDTGFYIYKPGTERAVGIDTSKQKHNFPIVDQEKFGWAKKLKGTE